MEGDDAGVQFHLHGRARVAALQHQHAVDGSGPILQQVLPLEAVRRADAMKAGLGGGARQQRGDGSNHAGGAFVALVAHQHVDVAALGNVVTVQGLQATDDHQPAAGHGGAGVAGQPHRIQIAIGEDAVTRGAQEAGQTVLHRQCGGLIEEGRIAFRVEGQRVGRRRQMAVGPGWLCRPKGRGIKGGSRSQGSGHRVISCKQGRHGLPIEITRSAAHRLDNRQLPGRMFRSCLMPLKVSSPPSGGRMPPATRSGTTGPAGAGSRVAGPASRQPDSAVRTPSGTWR